MSKIKTQNPIVHTPSFKIYEIGGAEIASQLKNLGLRLPVGLLDSRYFYTDAGGWGKLLADLLVKSNLYSENKFDCDNMALRAMNTCAERYGLNTMAFIIGDIPQGRHAFNLIYTGTDWLVFEANAGFGYGGQAFPIGAEGYLPEMVLI